jgi:transposase
LAGFGEAAMVKVTEMLKTHLPNILTYFKHRITNAVSEGLNSKIQAIKATARGFRGSRTTGPGSCSFAGS